MPHRNQDGPALYTAQPKTTVAADGGGFAEEFPAAGRLEIHQFSGTARLA
jgi:hypothetical protein